MKLFAEQDIYQPSDPGLRSFAEHIFRYPDEVSGSMTALSDLTLNQQYEVLHYVGQLSIPADFKTRMSEGMSIFSFLNEYCSDSRRGAKCQALMSLFDPEIRPTGLHYFRDNDDDRLFAILCAAPNFSTPLALSEQRARQLRLAERFVHSVVELGGVVPFILHALFANGASLWKEQVIRLQGRNELRQRENLLLPRYVPLQTVISFSVAGVDIKKAAENKLIAADFLQLPEIKNLVTVQSVVPRGRMIRQLLESPTAVSSIKRGILVTAQQVREFLTAQTASHSGHVL